MRINKQKIDKLKRESIKHWFKPEINPVSKIITERDRINPTLNKSDLTDISISQQLINISVHDKLHLSRNNSQWYLQQHAQSWIQQSKELGSRSNSVADFKTYWSKMQRISERKSKWDIPKGQKSIKHLLSNVDIPVTPQVNLFVNKNIEWS